MMSFLRLGTISAIFNENDEVLVSKRGDLNIWTLPGGRLDSGESIKLAAKREVEEETGVQSHIERAVNLYYWPNWKRLNILFEGVAIGGELKQKTDESQANTYMPITFLEGEVNGIIKSHLTSDDSSPYPAIIQTGQLSYVLTRIKLAWRWLFNLLRGKPEPRHVHFDIDAVAVIRSRQNNRILALPDKRSLRLPKIACNGNSAPWETLGQHCEKYIQSQNLSFRWVGLHQITQSDSIQLIFACELDDEDIKPPSEWITPSNAALETIESHYVDHITNNFDQQTVWFIIE